MSYECWQDSTGIFLKRIGEDNTKRYSLAERMMLYQDIPGFLPFEIHWINGKKETIYDITGRVSLSQFIKETEIKIETLHRILSQIFQMEKTLEEYLLEGNHLLISTEYLYVEKNTETIYGIYDVDAPEKGMDAISRLLEEIMDIIDTENTEVTLLLYRLHTLTKEKDGTRNKMITLLEESMTDNAGECSLSKNKTENEAKLPRKEKLPFVSMKKKTEEKQSYVVPGMLFGIGVLLFSFLWQGGYLNNPVTGEMDKEKMLGALVFFSIVVSYGVWKTMPVRKKQRSILYEELDDERKVCLISKLGRHEPIQIDAFPYRLGSEETMVHQKILSEGISPIHARIEREGVEIYVLDEESKEGTFKNNERLVPFQKTILRDGDLLRLGKEEYVVEIT